MKPVLIGLMPNKSNQGPAMAGDIGLRLCKWAGIKPVKDGATICTYFETLNLNSINRPELDILEAMTIKSYVMGNLLPVPWIMCGKEVAEVFGRKEQQYWRWSVGTVVIPHPSGLNRLYNNAKNRSKTGRVLREALKLNGVTFTP